jgi:hypothetical protein
MKLIAIHIPTKIIVLNKKLTSLAKLPLITTIKVNPKLMTEKELMFLWPLVIIKLPLTIHTMFGSSLQEMQVYLNKSDSLLIMKI